MSGNAISPLLAFLRRSPSFYGLLKVSIPHPHVCLASPLQKKGSVSVFVKLTLLLRVQRLSSLSISLGLEIKLPHKFPPSHAGCAAVYLRGVACNIRLASHCMFYLSGVEEQDVPKKQTVLAGQCLR